jgi:hypothetical protein
LDSDSDNSTLLTRYLLGELSNDEELAVEQRFFGDADFLEELQATERDLIDCYVQGELNGERKERFEARFLTSPRRRKRVQFAYTLSGNEPVKTSANARSGVVSPLPVPVPVPVPAQSTWTPWRTILAAAASILVVGILALWWSGAFKSSIPLEVAETEKPAEPGPAPEPPVQPPIAPPAPTGPTLATFLLTQISRPRSLATEQTLTIESGVTDLRLNARLDSDDQERYEVVLKRESDRSVVARPRARSYKSSQGPALAITLKASAVRSEKYELHILDSNRQPVAVYYFRIEKH